ncbi:DNA topoisomerase 2-beta [Sparganum proliferum]
MLMSVYRDERPGISVAGRTDGQLLNIRHMQASKRLSTTTVHDWLFADDYALDTATEENMKRSLDVFVFDCANFGLTINTNRMVIMHQPPRNVACNVPRINVNGT